MKNAKILAGTVMMAAALAATSSMVPMHVYAAQTEAAVSEESGKKDGMSVVSYEDGVDGSVFETIKINVKNGNLVPDCGITPERDGFIFAGWAPSAKGATVDGDVVYKATWKGDDSLTDEDRKTIASKADETKSVVSVEQVSGEVTEGNAVTSASSSANAEPVDGVVDGNPVVADGGADNGNSAKVENTDVVGSAAVSVEATVGEDDGEADAEDKIGESGSDGKQDFQTDDVKTGDMDLLLYFGAGAVAIAAIGGAVYVLGRKKA